MDGYSFAAEVAMHQLSVEIGETLDGLLCNPDLASRFDELAAAYSPGYSAFEYRLGALSLRKRAKGGQHWPRAISEWMRRPLPRPKKLDGKWSNLNCPEYTVLWRRAGMRLLTLGEGRLILFLPAAGNLRDGKGIPPPCRPDLQKKNPRAGPVLDRSLGPALFFFFFGGGGWGKPGFFGLF